MDSAGNRSRSARTTVSPPSPESNTPSGASAVAAPDRVDVGATLNLFDAKHPRGLRDVVRLADGANGGDHTFLARSMRDHDDGNRSRRSYGATVLDHLLDADPVLAERACDAG